MSNIDGLAAEWMAIKAQEKDIIAKRHAIEEQLVKALEAKDEGSISHKLDGHKVTLTQPVTRKVDAYDVGQGQRQNPRAYASCEDKRIC